MFVWLFILPICALSQARRAIALMDKDKTEEAYEVLDRALKKDSLAAAEKYVLAKLFFSPKYGNSSLDSAYQYILWAIRSFDYSPVKLQTRMSNNGFNTFQFGQLKGDIEVAGFQRAKEGGMEQDYVEFLAEFPTSEQVDSAVVLRNIQAFLIAEKSNTYQSYKQFFTTYPEANEVMEARKRYENLLYLNMTRDGKLNSYEKFLVNYPDTWHRKHAEQHIYNIITGRNTIASYNDFIKQYPQSFLKNQALLSEYAMLNESEKVAFIDSGKLSKRLVDSLRLAIKLSRQLLVPIIHNKEYQLINAAGKVITKHLANINAAYKCNGPITDILLTDFENGKALITPLGHIIAQGDISAAVNEGNGILKLITSRNQYFLHTAGFRTNNHFFNKARVAGLFIAYQEKSKWGLESITGISMLAPKYDSIAGINHNILIKKGKKWGIFPYNTFYPLLDGEDVDIKLTYDNILLLSDEYLMLIKGKKSSLLDIRGKIIVPMAEQYIELVEGGYFVDREDSILDSRVANKWYYDINYNEDWTIGSHGRYNDIYYKGDYWQQGVDVNVVGPSAAMITLADSTFCFFNDTTKLFINKHESVIPIGSMGLNSSVRHFIYTNSKKKEVVYSNEGLIVDAGKFDKLIDLGDDYILSRTKNAYNVLNNNGEVVLKEVGAATSLNNGYISYLSDKKFGLFNAQDSTLIKAKYNRPIRAYSDSLFLITEKGKFGIINRRDSMLVPMNYSEIRYLNDSIAILNSNFRWIFWDIKNRISLLDNVSDYWLLDIAGQPAYKIFKGIGYGIWSPQRGMILNSTYSEINNITKGDEAIYIAEKWVEEADIIIMLYYNTQGELLRKEVLSTAEYEDLTCKKNLD